MGTKSLLVSSSPKRLTVLTNARNVGLFRYWNLSNLPLFVLAAPTVWLLFISSATHLRSCVQNLLHGNANPGTGKGTMVKDASFAICKLPELALPQLLLVVLAVTSFHVQIVNRIASGYPVWYLMIATWVVDSQHQDSTKRHPRKAQWFVRGIVIYCLVQGMLFANFLPPA